MQRDFSKLACRDKQKSSNAFIGDVIKERPDLQSVAFCAPGMGECSITVMTVEEVFKTKRPDRGLDVFIIDEYKFLEHMGTKDLGEVQVPKVTTVGEERVFFGMERVQGEPLFNGLLQSLPAEEQKRIAQELAEFNVRFSKSFSEDEREQVGLSHDGSHWEMTPDKVIAALNDPLVRAVLSDVMDDCRKTLQNFVDTYNADESEKRTGLFLSDMHGGNIFYDRDTKKISAIDIGCGQEYPVEIAFAPLKHTFPKGFTDDFLAAFSEKSGMTVTGQDIDRMQILYSIVRLRNAMQQQNGDEIRFHKERILGALAPEEPLASPKSNLAKLAN